MRSSLSVVADGGAAETMGQRVRRLQAETRTLAREHVQELQRLLLALERTSAEIADGGEAYPAGVRELARQLAEEAEGRTQTLAAIVSRAH